MPALATVPCYRPLFETDERYFILSGGRDSGKSKAAYQAVLTTLLRYPDRDVFVCRDTEKRTSDSSYAEIESLIREQGLEDEFVFGRSPLRIKRRNNHGTVYFFGVSGPDLSRTKSIKSLHPVGMILFEELQQLKTQEHLEQAMASFRRLLAPDHWRVVYCFNPPAQNAHWVNVWSKLKKSDPDYVVIHSTYMDVLPFLSDMDLKEIVKCKLFDPDYYRYLYEGIPSGGFGSIYPMFDRSRHLLGFDEIQARFSKYALIGLVIGVDGAVTRDSTACVPLAILANGQTIVLDIFLHDPKKSLVKSSSELMDYITIWFHRLVKKYNLRDGPLSIPIVFKVDSAAADLRRELMYRFSDVAYVESFRKPTILEMVGVVQSALARNSVYLADYGGYQDYVLDRWIRAENPLAVQLENLIWNERQTGYDPIVPNDVSDAFTYAVNTYFKNPDNLGWLEAVPRKDYYDLKGEML